MKILVISFYFRPDLSAGSFRCSALIEQLKKDNELDIEVITTAPNRYASYSVDVPENEKIGKLNIHRVILPPHKSGIFDQAKAFFTFYRQAIKLTCDNQYDIVFATSSRLFTAFLGARIAKTKNIPLYLDIRDIFVDTINDVLPSKFARLAKPLFSMVERYAFGYASRINLVSKGFAGYFNEHYPNKEYRWFTNGIDQEFIDLNTLVKTSNKGNSRKRVLYAGNIGDGQGLHHIIPQLARRFSSDYQFIIIGDGGKKTLLLESVKELDNVDVRSPMERSKLIAEYLSADILFLHLNDYPAFKKVLPSKIFEYAALGKPIWAGVSGYAAEFLREEVSNVAIFPPCDVNTASISVGRLDMANSTRPGFIQKFARTKIAELMAHDVIEFGRDSKSVHS